MWKQLLHRIYNERKQNTWLFIELLVVLSIVWVAFNNLYKSYQLSTLPTGTDITNCWRLHLGRSVSTTTDGQPDFSHDYDAVDKIMENLRADASVDAIGLTAGSMPYSKTNNSIGIYLTTDSLEKDRLMLNTLVRYYTKDVMRVFRCKDIHGHSLADQLPQNDKEYIIPTKLTALNLAGHTNLIDTLTSGYNRVPIPILQIAEDIRYTDYRPVSFCCYQIITNKDLSEFVNSMGATQRSIQLCIRMKHDMTQLEMEKWLNKNKSLIDSPPIYINSATSFKDIRKSGIRLSEQSFNQRLFLISFLLACAFLGILGAFWLRTSQRKQEIGLRMAMGGSKREIILHFIYEGLLILFCTLPLVALYIGYYITTGYTIDYDAIVTTTIITTLVSVILMSLLIIGGVLISAWSTFKIQAAEVLHDE